MQARPETVTNPDYNITEQVCYKHEYDDGAQIAMGQNYNRATVFYVSLRAFDNDEMIYYSFIWPVVRCMGNGTRRLKSCFLILVTNYSRKKK